MWVGLGVKYYQGNYGSVIWRCILSDEIREVVVVWLLRNKKVLLYLVALWCSYKERLGWWYLECC